MNNMYTNWNGEPLPIKSVKLKKGKGGKYIPKKCELEHIMCRGMIDKKYNYCVRFNEYIGNLLAIEC